MDKEKKKRSPKVLERYEKWKKARERKKRLEEIRKRDPFIYD